MANTEQQTRLVIKVPVHFHRRLKSEAALEGRDMRDLVIDCVSACLDKRADVLALKAPSAPDAAPKDAPKPTGKRGGGLG